MAKALDFGSPFSNSLEIAGSTPAVVVLFDLFIHLLLQTKLLFFIFMMLVANRHVLARSCVVGVRISSAPLQLLRNVAKRITILRHVKLSRKTAILSSFN